VLYPQGCLWQSFCVQVNGYEITPGADLSRASLPGAVLEGAVLYRCRFDGAVLSGADFRGARVGDGWDSYTDDCHYGPWFDGVDLTGANFASTSLYFTSFRGAIVRGADFSGVNLDHYYSLSADALNEAPDLTGAVYDATTIWPDGLAPSGSVLSVED